MTSISLHGRVSVKPAARKALPALIKQLQPDSDDIIAIEDNVLSIQVDCDAPRGFHVVACKAVSAFCEEHATAGAIFDCDGSARVVGPGAQAKKNAHEASGMVRSGNRPFVNDFIS